MTLRVADHQKVPVERMGNIFRIHRQRYQLSPPTSYVKNHYLNLIIKYGEKRVYRFYQLYQSDQSIVFHLSSLINEKLWIGHFDITSKNGIPAFRHTLLSGSDNDFLHKKLEDLVDIAIYECEKYYPSFQQVLFDDLQPSKSLVFANFEVIGTA